MELRSVGLQCGHVALGCLGLVDRMEGCFPR